MFEYEKQYYGLHDSEDIILHITTAIYETRRQIKAACGYIELRNPTTFDIHRSSQAVHGGRHERRGARHHCRPPYPGLDPEYILTEDEVNRFMNNLKCFTCCRTRWILHGLTILRVAVAIIAASGSIVGSRG